MAVDECDISGSAVFTDRLAAAAVRIGKVSPDTVSDVVVKEEVQTE